MKTSETSLGRISCSGRGVELSTSRGVIVNFESVSSIQQGNTQYLEDSWQTAAIFSAA